uniref:CAZy families GH32 protein n=1 Tax=uncultured Lactobacillus sp. TaxID=153152 RepID=A0A060BTL7_9LACO|nr:CAZy families GH32 protein [uncultured Lactobacillus sp.]
MGYMIECPNLVFVDNKPVLIFCPQGLDHEVSSYANIYPNMYIVGEKLNLMLLKWKLSKKYHLI